MPTTTSFSPLQIRSADTPPKNEKAEITPGRELTREERKVARRRNGAKDVLPSYAGQRLTFTLPSAAPPQSTSNHSSQPRNQSPLGREISLAELTNSSKSLKGKEKAQSQGLLAKIKPSTISLPIKSPSKLFVPVNAFEPQQSTKPSSKNRSSSHKSDISSTSDPSPPTCKQPKKSRPLDTINSNKPSSETIASSSKKPRITPPPPSHQFIINNNDSHASHDDDKSDQDERSSSPKVNANGKKPKKPKPVIQKNNQQHPPSKLLNKKNGLTNKIKQSPTDNHDTHRLEPLQETNPNLITNELTATAYPTLSTESLSSLQNKENIPLPPSGLLSNQITQHQQHQFMPEPYETEELLAIDQPPPPPMLITKNLPSSSSIKTTLNHKPIIPLNSKGTNKARIKKVIVQRKEEGDIDDKSMSDEVTPTVLNTPVASSSSSNESDHHDTSEKKMRHLAAKIFTPGHKTLERNYPTKVNQVDHHQKRKSDDINSLFDPINQLGLSTTTSTTLDKRKGKQKEEMNDDQEEEEEQIYIVADRLLRTDDTLEKSIEDDHQEGGLSLDSQRLLLKIKSQLNPPDIILISIRKLIQDQLPNISDHPQEQDERNALDGTMERFQSYWLECADELVRFGLLKFKLQAILDRNKLLKSNLDRKVLPAHRSDDNDNGDGDGDVGNWKKIEKDRSDVPSNHNQKSKLSSSSKRKKLTSKK
ncbi:hypothetical protein MJO29_011262 [Puccinia striiformis f. sp. tritici]|nr:hypothetical protein MJO29_011262 [Puccinia striiformis f. sp. tritici]